MVPVMEGSLAIYSGLPSLIRNKEQVGFLCGRLGFISCPLLKYAGDLPSHIPLSLSPASSCLPFRLLPPCQRLLAPLQRGFRYVCGGVQTSREGLRSHGAPHPQVERGSRRPDGGSGLDWAEDQVESGGAGPTGQGWKGFFFSSSSSSFSGQGARIGGSLFT